MKSKIKIERILYPKTLKTDAGDYSIFTATIIDHLEGENPEIHPIYKTITLKGIVPSIQHGDDFVALYGEEEVTDYGTSYKLFSLTKELNRLDVKQIRDYLEFICGKTLADEMIKVPNVLDLIENRNDEELLKIKGVGVKKLEQIYKNVNSTMDNSYAYAELSPLGITTFQINAICTAYNSPQTAVEICKTNPYDIVKKVKGISFAKADEIAMKCGLNMNSKERLECAINYILGSNGSMGKTYTTNLQLLNELYKLNFVNWDLINEVIMEMASKGQIYLLENGTQLALKYYFELEREIAIELLRLLNAESHIIPPKNIKEIINGIEECNGWKHTTEQFEGILKTLKDNVVIIRGYAGTGKSTIVNAITNILQNFQISQTCLSAKASQRLQQVTLIETKTIHRLLNLGYQNEDEYKEKEKNIEIYADILIIDEFSMVNATLFLKLLKALKNGSKLVLLGDTGQLQAIGDGCCMADMIKSGVIPVVDLTQIHRQAQASAIVTKSIDARHQKPIYEKGFKGHRRLGDLKDLELFILEKEEIVSNVIKKFKEEMDIYNDVLEVQIICPMKTRGMICTTKINTLIQNVYNPKVGNSFTNKDGITFYIGDKVINTVNNYSAINEEGEKTSIYNGSIGIVKEITNKSIIVKFEEETIVFKNKECDNLNLAYCISVHSSQGSQWKSVIFTFDNSSYMLLNVEMLYTGLTRASLNCALIANDSSVQMCLKNIEQKTKQTYLDKFLFHINEQYK